MKFGAFRLRIDDLSATWMRSSGPPSARPRFPRQGSTLKFSRIGGTFHSSKCLGSDACLVM
jgi:hypothetical protein